MRVFVSLIIFFAASYLMASALSLHRLDKGLHCSGKNLSLTIDRYDEIMKLQLADKNKKVKKLEFKSEKFLGQAVMFKSQEMQALFHLHENSDAVLILGRKYNMRERGCDDTGASKTCKSDEVEKLFWSFERLEIQVGKDKILSEIKRYGVFHKSAGYFQGKGITLVDFGSNFSVYAGKEFSLACKQK